MDVQVFEFDLDIEILGRDYLASTAEASTGLICKSLTIAQRVCGAVLGALVGLELRSSRVVCGCYD